MMERKAGVAEREDKSDGKGGQEGRENRSNGEGRWKELMMV